MLGAADCREKAKKGTKGRWEKRREEGRQILQDKERKERENRGTWI